MAKDADILPWRSVISDASTPNALLGYVVIMLGAPRWLFTHRGSISPPKGDGSAE